MAIKDYKDLKIWQNGIEIVDLIYKKTLSFPSDEKFGLVSQMRRSGVSIPSNIAEGFSRQHKKEYKHFLFITLGSCAELETQLIISLRNKYIGNEDFELLEEKLNHEMRMIRKLIKTLLEKNE